MAHCYGHIRGEFGGSDYEVRAVGDAGEECELVLVTRPAKETISSQTFSAHEAKGVVTALRRFIRAARERGITK